VGDAEAVELEVVDEDAFVPLDCVLDVDESFGLFIDTGIENFSFVVLFEKITSFQLQSRILNHDLQGFPEFDNLTRKVFYHIGRILKLQLSRIYLVDMVC
jgi:hypothetical protein